MSELCPPGQSEEYEACMGKGAAPSRRRRPPNRSPAERVRFEEETETKQYAPWRAAGAHIV